MDASGARDFDYAFQKGRRSGLTRALLIAQDEPNLPGPMPEDMMAHAIKMVQQNRMEDLIRIFSDSMREAIVKKIKEAMEEPA